MQKTAQVAEGYRLSPQQKQVWLLQQNSRAYYAQCAILIEGDLEPEAFKSTLKKIMQKHEILRTTLGHVPNLETPIQVILKNTPLPYRKVDLSGERSEEIEILLGSLFREESRSFDLNQSPLVRFCLVHLSELKQVLLVSLQALCADSRTLKNLFKEISSFYAAELEGKECSRDGFPYIQFSEWQNELLDEQKRHGARVQTRPASADLILPLEFDSAEVTGSAFAPLSPECCTWTLNLKMTERIESLDDDYHFSPSDFLLACWQTLLWWHTGEQEIITDCLFDGRLFDELHDALGLFDGYAPARAMLSPGLRFHEVMERTSKALQQVSAPQEPFLSEPVDGRGIAGIHRIGFEYEKWPESEYSGGVRFSYRMQRCCLDRFKIKLGGYRKTDGLTIEIQYDPARFSKEAIELVGERYLKLVESAVDHLHAPIGELEIFGRKELETLLVEWNQTEKGIPGNECVHNMVAMQAERTPDRPALFDDRRWVSYGELNRRANQIGNHLQSMGVRPETVVGVCFGRSVEMIVAILGVLKAGGAYLPLDPESPPERSAFMLDDAGVGVVLTERASEKRLPVFWGQSICLDEEWERISEESECEPESGVEPENQAYLIYTSGSTGRPKGVMVRHRSLVNYTLDICRQLGIAERDSSPASPLSFATVSTITADLGNTCIYPSLVSGGCLHILSYETATDGAFYEERLRREPIDVLKIVPSHLGALLGAQLDGLKMLPSRFLILGGEALSGKLAEQITQRGEGCELINHYGPTETTVGSLTTRVNGEGKKRWKSGSIPIGRPIANTKTYILNRELTPLPVGADGELFLGGEGVSRGYWKRPELTAERFIPNPFSRQAGQRVYRTGDVARHLPGRMIEFIGRADNQVKIRGYRVELGEIEATLRSHPGVRDAVVVLKEDAVGQKRLIGYVVNKNKKTIKGQARRRLPNGMAIVEQNTNETDYLYEEIFKRKAYFKHGIGLPDGGCVIDIGANIGMFTLFVNQSRSGLRVYAFEPIKPIYETLKTNVQLYGGAGVKLYNMGIGEEAGTEWFTYYRGYSMMSGESRYATVSEDIEVVKRCMLNVQAPEALLKDANALLRRRFEGEKYQCDIKRLSDVIREEKIDRVDLLKVDVQRAEMDVLRGLREEDWEIISQIVMEVHDKAGAETEGRLEQIQQLLKIKGYDVVVEQDEVLLGTDRYNLFARKNGKVWTGGEAEWGEASVSDPFGEVEPEELVRFTRERVPEYMAPATIITLDELPLTRNGKLDREALPDPEVVSNRNETDEREHFTAYEELIGGIWKEVLNLEQVRPEDNFFELGGHSLLATQAISRVRSTFGIEIGVMSIFDEPTVGGLARLVEGAMTKGLSDKAPPLVKADRNGALPLSFAQRRLWFLDQLIPNNPFYNLPRAARIEGELNLEALERAINELIRRHEILRTRIEVKEGALTYEPVQVIDPWDPSKIEILDLTNTPEAQKEEEVRRIVRENAIASFDLRRGPVVRSKVLKLGESDHVVLFCTHHIAGDGWSLGVIAREIETLYQSYVEGKESPLPELEIQYADFAKWQRAYLADGVLDEEINYWKQHLANMAPLNLPADYRPLAAPTYRGAIEGIEIGEDTHEELKKLSRREGTTMFMTLMAAFKAILMRYSGQEDISVGTVVANRTRREMEDVIGFFVNTLVTRTDLSGNPSFRELLARERKTALEAYAHQEVPFEKLVEAINPERDLSASPLFQVTMLLQNTSQVSLKISGARLRAIGEMMETAQHGLSMNLREWRDGISGYLRYSCDLFERETIHRMARRYEMILAKAAANAEQRIREIDLMDEPEKRQILEEWNATRGDFSQAQWAHKQFTEQARRTADALAITNERGALTYGTLDRLTNQLAHYLQKLGVGPEVVVGICVERSLEKMIAILGVLKAGGAYLPLDADYPMERLTFMLEDAGVGIVLTERALAEQLPTHWGITVLIDEEWENIRAETESEPESQVGCENSAYIIYTSGSTGRPKGVIIEHKALRNLIEAQKESLQLGRQSRGLQFASISFDASVWEMFSILASGGCLYLYGEERLSPGADLGRTLRENQITMVTLPPSVLGILKEEGLPHLTTVIAAGETCPAELVDRWGRGRKFINAYGPTEATVCASMAECEAGSDNKPTIGRPIANTRIYLFEHELNVAPVGIWGELHISGEGLARAYLGRPELTAERFLPDFLSQEAGGRLYKTGDLARYLSNGHIEFSGRIDRQVKVRGYRIELEEVEALLASHPAVRQCAVVAHQDARAENRLTAYLICEDDTALSDTDLQNYLKERALAFMLPSQFVRMKEMPLLPSGKIDRQRLPLSEELMPTESSDPIAPRKPVEEILAGIFAQLLKRDRVGNHDDFFEIGGHSLSAMQVVSRVLDIFGVEIGVRSIFEEPTVERLAGRIEKALNAGERDDAPPLIRVERKSQGETRFPLSFSQQRLWFIDRLEPGNTSYHLPGAVRLEGKLDLEILERVINEIFRRHETLRTRLEEHDSAPLQVIDEWKPQKLEVLDLRSLSQEEREAEVERRKREEARTIFDLSKGPLFRVKVLILEDEQHLTLFSMHHIISDMWSMRILFREFGALYQAYNAGEPSPLPEIEIQYADYTVWQRKWMQGETLAKQLAYWKRQLAGIPSLLQLPTDKPRQAGSIHRGAHERFVLGPELSGELKRLSQYEGVTLFMVLLAAFQTLLARYSGEERIVVGTPVAGRNRQETEGIIGFFINTLVMATDLSGNLTVRELLKRVREIAIGAFMHQELPFEKLVEEVQPERDLNRQPLFQVMFVFQNRSHNATSTENLGGKGEQIEVENARFELWLTIQEEENELVGWVGYAADLFERETMVRLTGHLERLLKAIVANQESRVLNIPLLTETELNQILAWNRTDLKYDVEKSLQAIFASQTERSPDSLAVVFETQHLTYAGLDTSSNQLANCLKRMGAGPDTPVAICVERSLFLVVGLLGVLKAGATYLPLDPEHPKERLAFMLDDAQVPVIITQDRLVGTLADQNRQTIVIDRQWEEISRESRSAPSVPSCPENLAYIIYTSGSTGRPKGVSIPHQAIVNHMLWLQDYFKLSETDSFLQKTAFSFDASVSEFFAPLLTGGRIIMARPGGAQDSSYIVKAIADHEVTCLQLVPSLLRVLLDEPGFGQCRSLKKVISAGESLPVELLERFTASMDAELYNFYGPTEAAIDVTSWRCDRLISRPVVPIGYPIANTQVHILGPDLQSMPVSMPGEFYIGGTNLARGYLNRPELTAGLFIPHPHSEESGARLYRTGDLARRLPGGAVEYLRRVDHQVKLRGFRIELGEIEAALNQNPAIQESVVLTREDRPGDKRLVAYIVPERDFKQEKVRNQNSTPLPVEEAGKGINTSSPELSFESLRGYLQQKVPAYSVPSSFVILESLPLLANGKVARQALPAPSVFEARLDGYVAPSTPIEKEVARIFSQALGIGEVGIYDDFFILGGHSLLVIQVINRVNKAFQIELPVRALFDGPTVSSLVNAIVEKQAGQFEDDVLSRLLEDMEVAPGHE